MSKRGRDARRDRRRKWVALYDRTAEMVTALGVNDAVVFVAVPGGYRADFLVWTKGAGWKSL